MAPVVAFIVKPAGAENVPPVVPVRVTACAAVTLVQKEAAGYTMVAVGWVPIVMVTCAVSTQVPVVPVTV